MTVTTNTNATDTTYYGERTGTEARIPNRTLGQDDFLKLLAAQMSTQDPLNPKQDIDFIGQMAQFASLEQSKSMQGDIAILQANSLLGRTVRLNDDGLEVVGEVSAVQLEEGTPNLVVGGRRYELRQLLNIEPTEAPPVAVKPSISLTKPLPAS